MKRLLDCKVGDKVKVISHEEVSDHFFKVAAPVGSIGEIIRIFSWQWDSECLEVKFKSVSDKTTEYITIGIDRFNGTQRQIYKGDKPPIPIIEPYPNLRNQINYC